MSVNINLSAKKDLSLASLRRRYPTIESILVEASLVSLYRYKKKLDGTKYWVKENVTGPLFIVQHESKNDTVDHCVVVLNQEGKCHPILCDIFEALILIFLHNDT